MSYPLRRYNQDYTGRSPNNFVANEKHTLGPKAGPYHPIAPIYGPYFNDPETAQFYIGSRKLVPGVDYFGSNLIAEATALGNSEVCELILLKNMNEGDELTISYQTVGGLWQNHAQGMVDLYQAYLKDNRPIDFANIRGKPSEWNPSYHLHMLKDVIGWESIIVAIERLINVLTLRNVPAFEALIDWVMTRAVEFATEEEIIAMANADKAISLRRLLISAKKLNFNTVRISPRNSIRKPPQFFVIDLEFTNFAEGEVVYWDIDHLTTFPGMFKNENGSFRVVNKQAMLIIQTNVQNNSSGAFDFTIRIRRNSAEGPILGVSRTLHLKHTEVMDIDYGLLCNGIFAVPTTLHSPFVQVTAESRFLIPDDDYFLEIEK